jgi:acyl-CoA synthetase (AMP-forming)/AMP-acid ligase II
MSTSPAAILDGLARKRESIERTTLPPSIGAQFDHAVACFRERTLWVPVDGGPSLTYGEFGEAVGRCVAALHGLGVRRGTHVAVMLPASPPLAITWMALAKLGAVMLPVNTRYTARELDALLTGGDAELLIADAAHRDLLERPADTLPLPRSRIVLHGGTPAGGAGEWRALLDAAGAAPTLPAVEPDQLMTLQFTSGSTGVPKGCMLSHRYWTTISLVRAHQGPPVHRMLIDMPFHYMGGQWRFLMALRLGATAFVARQPSVAQMIDRLLAHEIDFCSVTPALAKQPVDPRAADLRLAWAGTMALPRDLHAALEARLGGAPVREMYGLTETGAAISMPVEVDWMTGSGSCGLAVPFRTLRIVDEAGRDVAPGQTGELWITGPGMMAGYYKRPDANADSFRDGWFRSGDLFRRDGDGFLSVLGRIKDVIRRSGENVSASEVEGVLAAMPEIVEAAVIGAPDALRGEEVKACLLLRAGLTPEDLPPERVLAFCGERLARFKLPRYVAYVGEMPKTPSGKIAKQALRDAQPDPQRGCFDAVDGLWR